MENHWTKWSRLGEVGSVYQQIETLETLEKRFWIYTYNFVAIVRFAIVAMANWMHFNDDGGCTIIIWIWFMHCINECKTTWMKWQCTLLWLLRVKCSFYLICPHIIQVQHGVQHCNTHLRIHHIVRMNSYNFRNVEYITVLCYAISQFRTISVGGICVLV